MSKIGSYNPVKKVTDYELSNADSENSFCHMMIKLLGGKNLMHHIFLGTIIFISPYMFLDYINAALNIRYMIYLMHNTIQIAI